MLSRVWQLYSRGQRLQRRSRIIQASENYEAALELLDWRPELRVDAGTAHARLTAQVLTARALNLAYLGEPSTGLRMLDQAEAFVHPADLGVLLHQRGLILWQSSRLTEAQRWFAAAEPLLEANGPDRMYAALFINRAGLLRDLGELRQGLRSAQRAVELYSEIDSPIHQAKARHMEAQLWLDLGEVPAALASFDELREQYRRVAPELEVRVQGSYGHALFYVGMYRQAIDHWAEAIAGLRQNGDLRPAAIHEYWRAVAAFEMGDLQLAGEWARDAMDSLYRQGNEPMAVLARLLILQVQFDSGEDGPDFPDKVERLCEALENRGWALRLNQAKILAARSRIRFGDLAGVEELLAGPQEEPGYEALAERLLAHLASAELKARLGRDPLPELQSGLGLLEDYRVKFGSVEFQAGVSALGVQLAGKGLEHIAAHGSPVEILEWIERSRAQALRIPPVKSSADPGARESLGRLRRARQRVWDLQVEGEDATGELDRVRDLEAEIRAHDRAQPGPGQRHERVAPEAIGELAAERDTAVINMFEVDGDLRAVVAGVGPMRQVVLMRLDEAAETGSKLGADLDALGSPYRLPERIQSSVEASLRRSAELLAAGVWEPLSDLVGDRDIVIVPHSKLAWVPWPLLPPLRGRPVTVAPSAEVWWRAATRPAATGAALVAAGPALISAADETAAVAGIYPGAHHLSASESDPEQVLKAIDGASVAHLAAHGHHEPDNVLFSRLDFAHGPLNAFELLGLDQPPAHVVLSSCDLGRSTIAVGNETLGFTAALLHAGTSTVVSSLGRVPDDLAAEMMIDYHRRCAAGATPAEALAAVGENRPWHPFVCFGA